jgi:hypothetical protein
MDIVRKFIEGRSPSLEREAQKTGKVFTLNPHLWKLDDMEDVFYSRRYPQRSKFQDFVVPPYNARWKVLHSFLKSHTEAELTQDLCLAFHGAKNENRATRILFHGLLPGYRRSEHKHAYFGIDPAACAMYGDIVVFAVVRRNGDRFARGDGAFSAAEEDALPIGFFQKESNYMFSNMFDGIRSRGCDDGTHHKRIKALQDDDADEELQCGV